MKFTTCDVSDTLYIYYQEKMMVHEIYVRLEIGEVPISNKYVSLLKMCRSRKYFRAIEYRRYLVFVDINLSDSSFTTFYISKTNPKLTFLPYGMTIAVFQIKKSFSM